MPQRRYGAQQILNAFELNEPSGGTNHDLGADWLSAGNFRRNRQSSVDRARLGIDNAPGYRLRNGNDGIDAAPRE